MIIRSQDELRIETFNNAEVGHGCNAVYVNGLPFGVYSTEKKAVKVLGMICEQYMKNQALYIDRENNARVIPQNSVFQMPADEDVEV